jgi:hypothetical protein
MLKRMAWATMAAPFFAATFVVNHAISLKTGHWTWTASLRYFWMLMILILWTIIADSTKRKRASTTELSETVAEFRRHWKFWLIAGTIGFVFFYAPLAFASAFAPGWVVAATFMTTVAISPFVIRAFGNPVPKLAYVLSFLVTIGCMLIIFEHARVLTRTEALCGIIPPLISAIAYPIGSQLVASAMHGQFLWLPKLDAPIVKQSHSRVLLMTIGTLPAWALLLLVVQPPAPSSEQWLGTALVALSAGVIATSLYLKARQHNTDPYQAAAVEATQTSHVLLTLLLEMWILNQPAPGIMGWIGTAIVAGGQLLYILFERSMRPAQ